MSIAMMRQRIKGYRDMVGKNRERINDVVKNQVLAGAISTGLSPVKRRMISSQLERYCDFVNQNERQIDKYLVEIYKKYSLPVACIVFVLIGAPLGIMARRGGMAIAIGMSLGFFVIYWAFLIGGEDLADRQIVTPFWAMWSADILLGAVGLYLVNAMVRETKAINWRFIDAISTVVFHHRFGLSGKSAGPKHVL